VKNHFNIHYGTIGRKAFVLAPISFALLLAACSGGGDSSTAATTTPTQSALLPVQYAAPCPITSSSIDSLVTKGTGLAFNGATFGNVGTYT
jgi:hypothetical protein